MSGVVNVPGDLRSNIVTFFGNLDSLPAVADVDQKRLGKIQQRLAPLNRDDLGMRRYGARNATGQNHQEPDTRVATEHRIMERMTKRDSGTKDATRETTTPGASSATTTDPIEQRLVALAEQLGRVIGTIQAKAEGWMDRETLNQQIVSVRDGAAHLLEQLADATKATKIPAAATARAGNKGRSGGTVDAPGKRHRKPARNEPSANVARSQADKLRTAKTMKKTHRRRGRG